jgi:thiol-disulfide isomerase/thioredoxin
MRKYGAVFLFLLVSFPLLADDKPKVDPPAPSKLKEQMTEVMKEFQKDASELRKAFAESKSKEEKDQVLAKFNKLKNRAAKQVLEKVEALPKDPGAADALTLVVQLAMMEAEGKKALTRLAMEHSDNQKLPGLCRQLGSTPEGEKLLLEMEKKGKDEKLPGLVALAEQGLFASRNLAVGKPAPDTESTNLDGKTVKIPDYKGKVVVLDFWATWCGPCRGMIPHERELVKKNEGKPFVFISVSADAKKETLKDFLAKEEMPWVHWWSGTGGITEKWGIAAFPTLYIIDAKGVIRSKIVGGGPENEAKIDDMVSKLIKEAGSKSE